jgi:hypothetical protein
MAKQNIPHSQGSAGITSQSDAISKIPQKGFFSRAIDFVTGAPVKLAEYVVWSPFVVSIAGSVLSGLGKLEKIPGFKTIGSYAKSGGQRINSLMDKEVGQVFTGHISKKIGTTSQTIANAVGDGVNKAASAIGIPEYAPKLSDMNALRHLGRLRKAVETIKGDTTGKIVKASLKPEIPQNLHNAIDEMVKLAESKQGMSLDKFKPHSDAFLKLIDQNKEILDKKAIRILNKILDSTGKTIKSNNNASIWRNLGQMFKAVPAAISSSKVLPGAANVALIVLAVASLGKVVTNFFKNVAGLKTMSKDITGKEASTMEILTGKAPAPIKEARSKLIKSSIVSGITDTASLGLVTAMAVKGNVGFLSFMAPQAVSMGVNSMIGESSLPLYTELSQAHASGQKISGEAYAALIGAVSPEIKARGGADSKFAQELGKIYAEENASPAQVMRRIVSGEMLKDVNALIAANETARAAPVAATGIAAGTHVAALQKSSNPMGQKPVVGDNTARLVANASQANHALGA